MPRRMLRTIYRQRRSIFFGDAGAGPRKEPRRTAIVNAGERCARAFWPSKWRLYTRIQAGPLPPRKCRHPVAIRRFSRAPLRSSLPLFPLEILRDRARASSRARSEQILFVLTMPVMIREYILVVNNVDSGKDVDSRWAGFPVLVDVGVNIKTAERYEERESLLYLTDFPTAMVLWVLETNILLIALAGSNLASRAALYKSCSSCGGLCRLGVSGGSFRYSHGFSFLRKNSRWPESLNSISDNEHFCFEHSKAWSGIIRNVLC